ncbi:MAG: Endonuclease VIII [uncultured Nocardioidaceae bacterium]|uniref:DNA-(apurinic or apyrimidinic site) lyase n=1 Tax=uncultured Nocardioidaceae bacterium TaxID=253824 RepID=A0A6J4MFK0_9ACTN|nr:MAG: Endonuclease VIII [uncultured Nocardioidaceae bacterium]
MPEGHTLHRLASELDSRFAGDPVRASSPQGRFAEGAALLDGATFEDAEAYGKHLFGHFDTGRILHVHLGLYGTFLTAAAPPAPPRGAVRLRLTSRRATADLRGPTACELFTPDQRVALLSRLGPDPLRDDADPAAGWTAVHRSRRSLASLLMDQSVIAGIGNVYRAEVLYRQRLDPTAPGGRLTRAVWDDVWADLVELMHRGVRDGHIETLRPEHAPLAGAGMPRRYVYRRQGQPCLVCGTRIRTTEIEGRNLYWCPSCQRRTGRRRMAPAGTASPR